MTVIIRNNEGALTAIFNFNLRLSSKIMTKLC